MILKHIKYNTLLIIQCFILLLFISCTTENKIARSFLSNRKSIDIIVLKNEFLYKANLKDDSLDSLKEMGVDIDALTEEQKDSVGIENSVFLKKVNDSLLIEDYYNSTIEELKALGVNVITDTLTNNPNKVDSLHFVYNIAQLELDENTEPFEDQMESDTSTYVQAFELNELALDTWIESSEIKTIDARQVPGKKRVMFAEHTANDLINGEFERNAITGEINYRYKINRLEDGDAYKLANYAAKKNASYYFDYIMNKYIRAELKKYRLPPPTSYYHYNRTHNYLTPASDERFTIMK